MSNWKTICQKNDLIANLGVCAKFDEKQVAVFWIQGKGDATGEQHLFAIENSDPFSKANVLSRGIVGDRDGELFVASPIFKQRFSLTTGRCLDDDAVCLEVFAVREQNGDIQLASRSSGA